MKVTSSLKIGLLAMILILVSCKRNKKEDINEPAKTETQKKVETPAEPNSAKAVITDNLEAYPRDIGVFQNEAIADRLEDILGDEYGTMVDNFETQTPVVSENGIYKFTGCKQHDCTTYHTTVLYDAKNDNFNVIIEQKGKVKVYDEKGKIKMTKSLRFK